MSDHLSKDPLHGITLEALLTKLVEHYGWDGLADRIQINCFISDPSIKSSLKFLRRTPWARQKVEALYIKLTDKTDWLEGSS
ncbi:VF530 family protein [Yersinia aldovae]|uniref:VF530 family protein n=1 Tax=Yersinia aldovae TaxID=29483 RepID=UPI00119D1D44|nr:VF530 family DNA-binding protein [Yersinia aldovae]